MNAVVGFPGLNPNNGDALATPYAQGAGGRPRETSQISKMRSQIVVIDGDYWSSARAKPTRVFLPIEGDIFYIGEDVSIGPFLVRFNVSPSDAQTGENWISLKPGEVFTGPFKGVLITSAVGSGIARVCYGYGADVAPLLYSGPESTAGGEYVQQTDALASYEIAAYADMTGAATGSMSLLLPNQFSNVFGGAFRGVGLLDGQVSIKTVVPTASYTVVPLYAAQLYESAQNRYSQIQVLRPRQIAYRVVGLDTIIEAVYDVPKLFVYSPNAQTYLLIRSSAPYAGSTTAVPIALYARLLTVR